MGGSSDSAHREGPPTAAGVLVGLAARNRGSTPPSLCFHVIAARPNMRTRRRNPTEVESKVLVADRIQQRHEMVVSNRFGT